MASIVAENWVSINGDDGHNSKFDHALLMFLLEESTSFDQDYDDEQLNRVIQSLEAEISNDVDFVLEGHDSAAIQPENVASNHQDGRNCILASMELQWADHMELVVPCSPSDDEEMNWSYVDQFGLDLDDLVDYQNVSRDFCSEFFDMAPAHCVVHQA